MAPWETSLRCVPFSESSWEIVAIARCHEADVANETPSTWGSQSRNKEEDTAYYIVNCASYLENYETRPSGSTAKMVSFLLGYALYALS